MIRIGIDAYNGDTIEIDGKKFSATERVEQAIAVAKKENPDLEFLVSKDESSLEYLTKAVRSRQISGFFTIGDTTKVCKKALRLGRIETGTETKSEKMPPDLVAIMATVTAGEDCLLTDAGAMNDIDSHNLYCQGLMTAAYAKHFLKKKYLENREPRLGLLCNGTEENKGNGLVKETDIRFKTAIKEKRLSELLDYRGKVEPREGIFGELDIILASGGFVGNLYLKICEGIIEAAWKIVRQEFENLSGILNKSSAYMGRKANKEVARRIKERFNPEKYNGAILLGYNGIVVKGHGVSTVEGIYGGILRTREFIENDVSNKIKEALDKYS